MMPARTPMGEAAPGSRLDRLDEAQRIIRQLIERGGHTNRSIAEALACNHSTIADLRNGVRAPTRERLAQLRALATGLTVTERDDDGFSLTFRR